MPLEYVRPETISLLGHAEFSEKWVQARIAEDPSLLGLGDLILKDKERIQPRAGRLDLLFQDADSTGRYEVEIQLGQTDEAHIIRTIEYWDVERKRYPQYDHTAVIIAENITGRFLNVISLFNGVIPLIAMQMSAIKVGNKVSLIFTPVLDQVTLGLVDEDEEVQEVTDRAYWELRGTPETVRMADEVLDIIHRLDPNYNFKYNKFYIGLAKNDQPNNFVALRPKRNHLRIDIRIPRSDETDQKFESAGLDMMEYERRYGGYYRLRVSGQDFQKSKALLGELIAQAHKAASA